MSLYEPEVDWVDEEPPTASYDSIISEHAAPVRASEDAAEREAAVAADIARFDAENPGFFEPEEPEAQAPDLSDPAVLASAAQELARHGFDIYAPAPTYEDQVDAHLGEIAAEVGAPFDIQGVQALVEARAQRGEYANYAQALADFRALAAADAAERARPQTAEEVRSVGEALAKYHRQLAADQQYVAREAASPQVSSFLDELGVEAKAHELVAAEATRLLPSMMARHGRGREAAERALEAAAEKLHQTPAKTYDDAIRKHAARVEAAQKGGR